MADSSLAIDTGPNRKAYAAARIAQYVVVDLQSNRVLVHSEPAGEWYSRVEVLTRGSSLDIAAGSACVPVPVDHLLP